MRNISQSPRRDRVVLLGASNLARGLSTMFETARLQSNRPIDMFAAIGHGRSYANPTRVLGRRLPGILPSRLWNALENNTNNPPPVRTVALITDIGNDIVYGRSPDELLEWIAAAVDRLKFHDAEIAITTLPLPAIQRISRRRARFIKSLIYFGKGPDIDTALARAADVDQRVRALAAHRNLHLIELPAEWYGFDPIHIRSRDWPRAAAAMYAPLRLQPETEMTPPPLARGSGIRWLRLRTARPEQFHFAGMSLGRPQPSRTFPSGATLSLY